MPNGEASTWRELLRGIIRDQDERVRIAREIGVNPETLRRWATNETSPHWNETRALLSAVPILIPLLLRDLLGTSVSDTSPALQQVSLPKSEPSPVKAADKETNDGPIPSDFYDTVLQAAAEKTPRFPAVCNLVIPHALEHLDPHRLGMQIILTHCVPPQHKDDKVRSLRKCVAQGTPPWKNEFHQEQYQFLGEESLAGYAVMRQHWFMTANITEQSHLLPIIPSAHEVSSAAYPIVKGGGIAGCLRVSSTQVDYFTHTRIDLIRAYAHLISLAFDDAEFYPPERIELGIMPCWEVQKPYFDTFRRRVDKVQLDGRASGQMIHTHDAENLVRKMIEGELLALQKGKEKSHPGV